MLDVIFEQLWNLSHIYPEIDSFSGDLNIESHKFMMRTVRNTLLDWFEFLVTGFWPVPTEIFPINCEFDHFRISCFDIIENLRQFLMDLSHIVGSIVERFVEILPRLLFFDRDVLCQKVSSPSVLHNFFSTMDRKVRPVNLFRRDPQNLAIVITCFFNSSDKFIAGGKFNGGVTSEHELLHHRFLTFFWFTIHTCIYIRR